MYQSCRDLCCCGLSPVMILVSGKQTERSGSRYYVGRLGTEESPPNEYLQYVSASPGKPYRREAINEFRSCLRDTSLSSDDVSGIRKVSV